MTGDRVVAVVPALNEANTIGDVCDSLSPYTDDIVVVDDGSTDDTATVAREHDATVVEHATNEGYDRSIEDGFKCAIKLGVNIVFTFDADGQHHASDVPRLLDPIRSGDADVVVGRRPSKPRLAENLYAVFTRMMLGIDDPLCGLKVYRTAVYEDVGFFDRCSSIGTQLLFEAWHQDYDISQCNIKVSEREDTSRFGEKFEANAKILSAMGRIGIQLLRSDG